VSIYKIIISRQSKTDENNKNSRNDPLCTVNNGYSSCGKILGTLAGITLFLKMIVEDIQFMGKFVYIGIFDH
jgi:hypothetical protein